MRAILALVSTFVGMQPSNLSRRLCRFEQFEVDLSGGLLTRQGVRVKLQDQPFRILAMLLERPGEIVTREELRQQLWPNGTYVDFDGSLNAALKRLRAALDDDPDNPHFIETIPKRGYRFIAPVIQDVPEKDTSRERIELATAPANGGKRAPADAASPHLTAHRYANRVVILFGVFLLAIGGGATYRWYGRRSSAVATTEAAIKPVPSRQSIAVLGFRDVSGNQHDAWLATALAEMMSTELAGGEKLRLVSGEDVANLRLSSPWSQTDTLNQKTTARIGTALNGDFLILGSYATVGRPDRGQLRLDVRLQDAKSGEIMTEVAEIGSAKDLFQIVSRVGAKLRDRLGVPSLPEADEPSVIASLPSNSEAARFYTLGLVKLREFDCLAARDLFEQAIKADPKFPLAHSMLSRADIFLGHDDQAKTEAKQGLDLAGNLSRIQRMEIEASYYHAVADRAKAAGIYRVLFELYPDNLDYGLQLAKLQKESFHPDEALETIRKLRKRPPPMGDDPRLDLLEGGIVFSRDVQAGDRLYRSAAVKASAQGKKLIYAKAQEMNCYTNLQRLEAPPECHEAYEIFLAAGNHADAGACMQLMAEMKRLFGKNADSIPLYQRALAMFEAAGAREMIGVTQNNLSLVLENQGKWAQAEQTYRAALKNFQAVNDKINAAGAIGNIADMLVLRGRLPEAADMYRQAWELRESSGSKHNEFFHIQHAGLSLIRGEITQSRLEVDPQISSLREYTGDPWQLASALVVLGDLDLTEADFASARRQYQEALETLQKVKSPAAGSKVSLAELSTAEGHPERAESLLHEAITEFEKTGGAGDEIGGYTALARALLAEGKVQDAQAAIQQAFKLANLHDYPVASLPLQILEARALALGAKSGAPGRSDVATAQRELRAAIQRAKQLSLYNIESDARLYLGELTLKSNPPGGRAQLAALAAETHDRGFELISRKAVTLLSSSTH